MTTLRFLPRALLIGLLSFSFSFAQTPVLTPQQVAIVAANGEGSDTILATALEAAIAALGANPTPAAVEAAVASFSAQVATQVTQSSIASTTVPLTTAVANVASAVARAVVQSSVATTANVAAIVRASSAAATQASVSIVSTSSDFMIQAQRDEIASASARGASSGAVAAAAASPTLGASTVAIAQASSQGSTTGAVRGTGSSEDATTIASIAASGASTGAVSAANTASAAGNTTVNVAAVAQASTTGAAQAAVNAGSSVSIDVGTVVAQAARSATAAAGANAAAVNQAVTNTTVGPPAFFNAPQVISTFDWETGTSTQIRVSPDVQPPAQVTFTIQTVVLNGVLVAVVTNSASSSVTALRTSTVVGTLLPPVSGSNVRFDLNTIFANSGVTLNQARRENLERAILRVLGNSENAFVDIDPNNVLVVSPI